MHYAYSTPMYGKVTGFLFAMLWSDALAALWVSDLGLLLFVCGFSWFWLVLFSIMAKGLFLLLYFFFCWYSSYILYMRVFRYTSTVLFLFLLLEMFLRIMMESLWFLNGCWLWSGSEFRLLLKVLRFGQLRFDTSLFYSTLVPMRL